jgi:hypothetical protein
MTIVYLTPPPPLQSTLNYAPTPSDILALVSCAHVLGGISTDAAVKATHQYEFCDRTWSREASPHIHLIMRATLIWYNNTSSFVSFLLVAQPSLCFRNNFPYAL